MYVRNPEKWPFCEWFIYLNLKEEIAQIHF